ncbi:uncharacterized protein LOC119439949 [Dermacentor silvarum]|uniref:uncharacterized protein LOC119439949 n=1 Tax=Dermacentor silvarum TaxID=543639 RepID=UPI001897DBD7|nr:uncharacterized protein LOC119439949 [Dermacentor silvarum]
MAHAWPVCASQVFLSSFLMLCLPPAQTAINVSATLERLDYTEECYAFPGIIPDVCPAPQLAICREYSSTLTSVPEATFINWPHARHFSGQESNVGSMAHAWPVCASQVFLSSFLMLCLPPAQTAINVSATLERLDYTEECYAFPGIIPDVCPAPQLAICREYSSTLTSVPEATFINWPHARHFSGQESNVGSMAHAWPVCASQVCKRYSLYAKKSDNPYLLLLPCPQVFCEIACDCFSLMFLLLCSGDVETNPGPDTRSASLLSLEDLPDDPAEQMRVLFHLLKDLHTRSVQSAKSQAELSADIKSIKSSQKSIETKIGNIHERLDELEEETKSFDNMSEELNGVRHTLEGATTRHDSLEARLDDLEDRSRRDNLIFRGIPDSPESWEQSEARVKSALLCVADNLPDNAIVRAHRIGPFVPNKCRPIVVKFSNYKVKQKVLSARKKLKENGITMSEDFSPATRRIRSKLADFAKNQSETQPYQLRYKTLVMNKKHYVYTSETDSVTERQQSASSDNRRTNANATKGTPS